MGSTTAWAVCDIFPLGGCLFKGVSQYRGQAAVQQCSRTGRDMPFLIEDSLLVPITGVGNHPGTQPRQGNLCFDGFNLK